MRKAQGSLEYLIIIAAILAIAAIVVLFLASALQSEEHASYIGKCKQAASKCSVELSTSAGALCSYCYDSCVKKDQTEIFPGAYNFCLRGQADMIYEGAEDTIPPTISNVNIDSDDTTAVITWRTDEPASSLVSYAVFSYEEGGETIYNGNCLYELENRINRVEGEVLTMEHSIALDGLESETKYLTRIESVDGSGNIGEADVFYEFTTE